MHNTRRGQITLVPEALERRTLLAGTVVSVNPAGVSGNDVSDGASVTPDGRFVAFISRATDLVAGVTDTNKREALNSLGSDVFLRDRSTGTTTLVSRSAAAGNLAANSFSGSEGLAAPSVSDDGRFVAFHSRATDLVAGVIDTNDVEDVFVHDVVAGTTRIVTIDAAGRALGGLFPVLSGNGGFVAFHSDNFASSFVPGAASGGPGSNVYVANLQTGAFAIASMNAANTATGNLDSAGASISADGRFVAFESLATDLAAADTDPGLDVYLRDMQAGTTEIISVRPDGTAAGDARTPSYDPDVSADGRFVAFASVVDGLVAGEANGTTDVFLRDTQSDTTVLVSAGSTTPGQGGNGSSQAPSVSPDGRFVSFFSAATDVASTTSEIRQYVREIPTGQTRAVALVPGAAQPEISPDRPASVTADGRVAVVSPDRAAAEDTNNVSDIYFIDPFGRDDAVAPTATLASSQPTAVAGAGALDFIVVYTDNGAVNGGSVGDDDVEIVPPNGGPALPADLLSVAGGGTGTVVATYRILAPGGGTLDAADNGAYTVNLLANRVGDTTGNAAPAATLGTVPVAVAGSGEVADLVPEITLAGPTTVVGGAAGRAIVRVTNAGTATASGPLSISLYTSTGTLELPGAKLITTINVPKPVTLRPGASKSFKVRFTYPTTPNPNGSTDAVALSILASVDEAGVIIESNEANNVAASAAPVTIAPPFVDLVPSFDSGSPATAVRGGRLLLTPALQNIGNTKAVGIAKVTVFFSANDAAADPDDVIAVAADRKINLKPGAKAQKQKITVTVPADLPPGTYTLIVLLNTLGSIAEANPEPNFVNAPATIVIT